jgi:hypothetical protein
LARNMTTVRPSSGFPANTTIDSALSKLGRYAEAGLMADPGLALNCPTCGTPLVYLRTDNDTHVYRCPRHGLMLLPPDGRVRSQPQ